MSDCGLFFFLWLLFRRKTHCSKCCSEAENATDILTSSQSYTLQSTFAAHLDEEEPKGKE